MLGKSRCSGEVGPQRIALDRTNLASLSKHLSQRRDLGKMLKGNGRRGRGTPSPGYKTRPYIGRRVGQRKDPTIAGQGNPFEAQVKLIVQSPNVLKVGARR